MGLLWWGVCFGRLGREAGGTSSRKWRGEGGESLYCRASCHCANVRNQVWWWSKLRILSSQPYLVAAVPGQRVQIAEKVRLFQVFLDEWVKCGECRFVSLWDESCGAHLKAVHCAVISCDVCDEWCVFTWFLKVPLLDVAGKRNSLFLLFLLFSSSLRSNVWRVWSFKVHICVKILKWQWLTDWLTHSVTDQKGSYIDLPGQIK